jgi:hypothetical protein
MIGRRTEEGVAGTRAGGTSDGPEGTRRDQEGPGGTRRDQEGPGSNLFFKILVLLKLGEEDSVFNEFPKEITQEICHLVFQNSYRHVVAHFW